METDNPIVTRRWRGDNVESQHRGAWVVARPDGSVIDHGGNPHQLVYGRSATKSFQALPLIESGAVDRFSLPSQSLATAIASHSGEAIHRQIVAYTLDQIGLSEDALLCGPQRPFNAGTDAPAERITNNCSGKHAGFLAVSQMVGEDPARYLDPASEVQTLVKAAVASMCGVEATDLGVAVDGCSAPTFQLPLAALATGIARMANPNDLDPRRSASTRQLTDAAATHPELVAGTHERICTDLIAATNGRLFAKIGAEAVYVIGAVGSDLGLAVKIDDGDQRGLHMLLIELLTRHNLLSPAEREQLTSWSDPIRRNWDGLPIGWVEVVL